VVSLPSALDELDRIIALLDHRPAIFLDYDGTLTPIVSQPADARVGETDRQTLIEAAQVAPVTIISGRNLDDLRGLLSVPGLIYSGNHGWEIEGPDFHYEHPLPAELRADLDAAERLLTEGTAGWEGVMIERKRFSLALHTRNATTAPARAAAAALAAQAGSKFGELRLTLGKEVYELRPVERWDKGKALSEVLRRLEEGRVPIHLGDDENDEDAFRVAVGRRGTGIVVGRTTATAARFCLTDPAEVHYFLRRLTAALRKTQPVS
jgi:trehalose 6-phosphate phosphatase